MFNLEGSLTRLKKRLKESEVHKSSSIETKQISDGGPNLADLASEVTGLLDEGTVKPDIDKVKHWAISRGLEEEQASGFADTVINAYFDEDSVSKSSATNKEEKNTERKDKESSEKKEKKEGEEEEEDKEKKEVEKARHTLLQKVDELIEIHKSDLQVLTESIEYLMDKVDKTPDYSGEIQKLKSELADIKLRPATSKTPITLSTIIPHQKTDGIIPREEREKYFEVIQKGILAKKCQLEDINYFESTWKLPPRVQAFIQSGIEVRN